MKLKLIAPLLLSLLATPAFAHSVHDDDEVLPATQEAPKKNKVPASGNANKSTTKPAAKSDKAATEAPGTPAEDQPDETE